MEASDLTPIRRVVTGHNPNEESIVLMDGAASNRKFPSPGAVLTLIWSGDRTPADIGVGTDIEDLGARILGSPPPENGNRFCVLDIPPSGRRGAHHRTESIDYVIVLVGEIEMHLDKEVVHLKQGDILVQRGTQHSWVNRGSTYARLAVVLIDAKPLGIGTPVARSVTAGSEEAHR